MKKIFFVTFILTFSVLAASPVSKKTVKAPPEYNPYGDESLIEPVSITGLAKSMIFLLRSLAAGEASGFRHEEKYVVSGEVAEKFLKKLNQKFPKEMAPSQDSSEYLSNLYSRPFQYSIGGGQLREVKIRVRELRDENVTKLEGDNGKHNFMDFKSNDSSVDQALNKFRVRIPNDMVDTLFEKKEFLESKKTILKTLESDPVNMGMPVREIVNLIELLHLSAGTDTFEDYIVVSFQRAVHRMRLLSIRGAPVDIQISVWRRIRFLTGDEDLIEELEPSDRLVDLRIPVEYAKFDAVSLKEVPGLKFLKDEMEKLKNAKGGSSNAFTRFLESRPVNVLEHPPEDD